MSNVVRSQTIDVALGKAWNGIITQRGKAFGLMILGALLAFEIFNFSTTEFALNDVLGNLAFAGVKWSTILSIAFCGIDFAGIARIFTPEQGADEPAEVWYLFGAWLLAAAMNASLTWWGVSVAIVNHTSQGSVVVGNDTIRNVVPVFVALMVWVIRILIIGTFSVAGDRLFSQAERQAARRTNQQQPSYNNHPTPRPAPVNPVQRPAPVAQRSPILQQRNVAPPQQSHKPQQFANASRPLLVPASQLPKPAPKPYSQPLEPVPTRPEPTYHNLASSKEIPDDV
jgi:hypothetical protein